MPGPVRTHAAASTSRQVNPPRPPNAWILYRSDKLRELPPSKERRAQADVSRLISDMWKKESDAVKLEYERMADAKKAEHQRMYPDYRFQPMKKEDKARMREKQKLERERARAEKKPRRATAAPSLAASTSSSSTLPPPGAMPPPSAPAMPQQMVFGPPAYTVPMHMPYLMPPFSSEARFGPAGPSPPLSAASSPNETASSPEPHSEEKSQPSNQPSTSSSSCTSPNSDPSAPLALPFCAFPASHLPSPNPCVPQPHSEAQPQAIEQIRWQESPSQQQQPQPTPSAGLLPQLSTDWDQLTSAQLSFMDPQNPEEFLDFSISFPPSQPAALQPQQGIPDFLQLEDALQSLLTATGDRGIFSLATPNPSELVAQPQGELEVAVGPEVPTYDFNGDLFANFDFSSLDLPVEPTQVANPAFTDPTDFASLFRTPDNPEFQAFHAIQRQPSLFTQDVMQFLNLEAAEGALQDATATPATATVSPQQVTNAPVAGGSGQYVPPAGAVNSTVRRVAGSWKPPVAILDSSAEPFLQSWDVPAS